MLFTNAFRPARQLVFANEFLELWKDENNGHHSLFAIVEFETGDVICEFEPSAVLHTPSPLTIQINANEHICLQPSFFQYTNHSCSPNMFFDTTNGMVVCIKPIRPGDELTYFYPSTEWEMAQPFDCLCGSSNCLGYIAGASYLSKDVLAGYRLSDFIHQQLKNKHTK